MADGGVSWPSELELKLNLNAIKKCDQFVVNIIDSASQVALYKFKSDTQAWEKTDVEGALFVYMRSSFPKYSFFIMNRLNMNNIAEPITREIEFKPQDPFLLFRNKTSGIYGIWFYDSQECTRLSKLLISLSMEGPSDSARPNSNPELKPKAQLPSNNQVDILSMLTSAQKQFEKRTTEQTTPQTTPLEQKPPLETHKQQFIQQHQDQMDQLKQLMRGNNQTKQRAYSSPALPLNTIRPTTTNTNGPFPTIISENGFDNPKNNGSPKVFPTCSQMFASPDRSAVPRKLFQGDKTKDNDPPQKPPDQSVALAASLMSPMAFKTTNSPVPSSKPAPQKMEISPLTQDQLLQAMTYLLKNDSDFVKKLHEAYLQSLHEMLPT